MAHHARIERVTTEDGSTTLYDTTLGVHYRSIWGARTESRAVFIDGARLPQRPGPWHVIELGFGGATTFEQAVLAAREAGATLHYHSVERAPLAPMLLADRTGEAGAMARRALMMARADSKGCVEVRADDEQIILTLHLSDWSALPALRVEADAIFHDPFDPAINPESWTEQCFRWHAQHMRPDAVLATYGASGAARRAMQAAGLHVASLPGVGKKRELSIAALTSAAIAHGQLLPDRAQRQ